MTSTLCSSCPLPSNDARANMGVPKGSCGCRRISMLHLRSSKSIWNEGAARYAHLSVVCTDRRTARCKRETACCGCDERQVPERGERVGDGDQDQCREAAA